MLVRFGEVIGGTVLVLAFVVVAQGYGSSGGSNSTAAVARGAAPAPPGAKAV